MREIIFLLMAVGIFGVLIWLSYKSKQKRFPSMFAVALLCFLAFYLFQYGNLSSFSLKALSAEASFIREKKKEVTQDVEAIGAIRKEVGDLLADSRASQKEIEAAKTEILSLKKRVEAQGSAVDFVANNAKEAKELVGELEEKSRSTNKRLSELDRTMDQASDALKKMEQTTDYATTFLAAQNDNWQAFDQLREWWENESFPLRQAAANAYLKIRFSYAERITNPAYLNINWAEGVDPKSLSLPELTQTYSKLNPIYHAHLVNVVWERSDLPKKDRMAFLIRVLTDSNSVCARHFAAKHFVSAAGDADLKWQPFKITPLLDWWKTHNKEIQ